MQNTCTCADTSKDAKEIVNSKFDPKTIENILLHRTQEECMEINKAIAPLNGGVSVQQIILRAFSNTKSLMSIFFTSEPSSEPQVYSSGRR